MSTSFKGFALLAILVTAVGTVPAFAQSPLDTVPISVTTDKESYADGETIIISGETRDYISGVQLTISVTNPVGNRVYIDQIEVGTDKTYSAEITAGGSLWKAAGTYTVHVQYGGDNRANETTFEFSGSTGGGPSGKTIKVDGTDFSVRYSITGGKVLGITADVPSTALIISIETTSDGELT